jgi:DNA-binding NarL/FixJ family response regulator
MPTVVSARFEDLVALALSVLIAEDPNLDLVESDVSVDALEDAIERHRPKVALLNFGTLRSPTHVFALHRSFPGTALVVLANRPSAADCNQMLSYGATACLSKETEARDVISAIHLAARGMHVLPQSANLHGGDPVRIRGVDQLTPREGEVLEQLQEGATNAEIAEELAIGVETVRTHARKIYRKLGIASRRELARLEREGLVRLQQRQAALAAPSRSRTRSSSAS